MTSLTTTTTIINALGGNQYVATLTGVSHKAVSNWRGFGKFPPTTFVVLQHALTRIGHSAPSSLWSMRGPSKKRVRK